MNTMDFVDWLYATLALPALVTVFGLIWNTQSDRLGRWVEREKAKLVKGANGKP